MYCSYHDLVFCSHLERVDFQRTCELREKMKIQTEIFTHDQKEYATQLDKCCSRAIHLYFGNPLKSSLLILLTSVY